MRKMQWFIFLLLFLIGCNQKRVTPANEDIIPVADNIENFEVLHLSDYATSIEYIPLETNDSVLIGKVGQIAYENGSFVVLNDAYPCFVFNENGSFRCNLGSRGEGPDDYQLIHSFDINPIDQTILMNAYYRKFFIYDMDGRLKKYVAYPAYPEDYLGMHTMCFSTDTFFSDVVSYSSVNYRGILFTPSADSSQVVKVYLTDTQMEKDGKGFSVRYEVAQMCRYGNEIRYFKVLNDTIFTIDRDMTMKKAYVLDLGRYGATPEWFLDNSKDRWGEYVWPGSIYESSKYLFMVFFLGKYAPESFEYIVRYSDGREVTKINSNVHGIYNKETGKLQFMLQPEKKKLGLKNDLDDGPSVIWPKYISTDGKLVTYCSAEEFLEHYERMENPSDRMKEIARKLKPDDNPVVMVVSLKE